MTPTVPKPPFASVEEALQELRAGRLVVVCHEAGKAGWGYLVAAAQSADAHAVNFMAKRGRGLICVALTPARCDELELQRATITRNPPTLARHTISIEAREGVSTGISAADRARTIAVCVDPDSSADDLVKPGHVFPVRTSPGGVLQLMGGPEAAVDLARLAGLAPAAATCEILDKSGRVAGPADLAQFAIQHELRVLDVKDLVAFRLRYDPIVERLEASALTGGRGDARVVVYRSTVDERRHIAVVKGRIAGCPSVPVGFVDDAIATVGDTRDVVHAAVEAIGSARVGVLLGLVETDEGPRAAPPADVTYFVGAQILIDLGARSVRLLTDDPAVLATVLPLLRGNCGVSIDAPVSADLAMAVA